MVDISKGLKMSSLLAQFKKQEARETEMCMNLMTARDAALTECDRLRAERDDAIAEAAKANSAYSSADLIKATIAGTRFANEVQAIKNQRDSALAERDIYGAEVVRLIERNTDLIIQRDAALAERDCLQGQRDAQRACHHTLIVELSNFLSAFDSYHEIRCAESSSTQRARDAKEAMFSAAQQARQLFAAVPARDGKGTESE